MVNSENCLSGFAHGVVAHLRSSALTTNDLLSWSGACETNFDLSTNCSLCENMNYSPQLIWGYAKIFWSSTKMHLWEPSIKSHRKSISINVTLVFTMLSNSVFGLLVSNHLHSSPKSSSVKILHPHHHRRHLHYSGCALHWLNLPILNTLLLNYQLHWIKIPHPHYHRRSITS